MPHQLLDGHKLDRKMDRQIDRRINGYIDSLSFFPNHDITNSKTDHLKNFHTNRDEIHGK